MTVVSTASKGPISHDSLKRVPSSSTIIAKSQLGLDYDGSTPSATEGDTATDTDLETETEVETEELGRGQTMFESTSSQSSTTKSSRTSSRSPRRQKFTHVHISSHKQHVSTASSLSGYDDSRSKRGRKPISEHDLVNKYFRRDMVIFRNLDVLRWVLLDLCCVDVEIHSFIFLFIAPSAPDALLVVLITYTTLFTLMPSAVFASHSTLVAVHYTHAFIWCLIHVFGLGLLLRAQSKNKFLVKHFMKNYHYTFGNEEGANGAIVEAFANFKAISNASLCMTYGRSSSGNLCLDVINRSFLFSVLHRIGVANILDPL